MFIVEGGGRHSVRKMPSEDLGRERGDLNPRRLLFNRKKLSRAQSQRRKEKARRKKENAGSSGAKAKRCWRSNYRGNLMPRWLS